MDAFTGRRSIRRCVNWIDHWPAGPSGNTRSCEDICAGQHTGSRASRDAIQSCGRTGRWASGVAPWREPYELRGSSTVLRGARGEIPRAHSPRGDVHDGIEGEGGTSTSPVCDEQAGIGAAPGEDADGELGAREGELYILGLHDSKEAEHTA